MPVGLFLENALEFSLLIEFYLIAITGEAVNVDGGEEVTDPGAQSMFF